MAKLFLFVSCFAQVWSSALRQYQTWPARTYPGQLGFPTQTELQEFGQHLDGQLITPFDRDYLNLSRMLNLRVRKLPGLIVEVKSVSDIQKSLLFAKRNNLHTTIRSSGHDYIGRSTHDGSLNLNLRRLNRISFNLNSHRNLAGEVTIETGASWSDVYRQTDSIRGPDETGRNTIGRIVVGASGYNVAMGGYTQGGGHSPVARKYGLAVDNLLEATLVTADAKIHVLNASMTKTYDLDGLVSYSNDTSLFWAIRGGGGGTWGVAVDFTFKLHYSPERFRTVAVGAALLDESGKPINKDTLNFALQQLQLLSPDWGSYLTIAAGSLPGSPFQGYVVLYLNHLGSNSSSSNQEIEALLRRPGWVFVFEELHPTFLDFQVRLPIVGYTEFYSYNSLIQPSTIENATRRAEFVEILYDALTAGLFCNGTLIGGNQANVPEGSTPVHPGLRQGILDLSCGSHNAPFNNSVIETLLCYAPKLYRFGWGSYINEPAEDMPDWKTRFWNDTHTYNRLLNIKKKVDPDNYLWCHNCVGSDLGYKYSSPVSSGIPGQSQVSNFSSVVWN